MNRYRLYTEDKNRKFIDGLFKHCFDAFTVYKASGMWGGVQEKSLVYEIIECVTSDHTLRGIAEEIKAHNKQQAVLITKEEIKGEII